MYATYLTGSVKECPFRFAETDRKKYFEEFRNPECGGWSVSHGKDGRRKAHEGEHAKT